MNQPAFSLILATVNRTAELERMLSSLAEQTFRDFEIIIVDQNTDDRLQPYVEKACQSGLKIIRIRHHPANLSAARNAGLLVANGDMIGFPDDDCWYEPDLLKQVMIRFSASDAPDGVSARWIEESDSELKAGQLTWERSKVFRDIPVASITLFFRRGVFDKVGNFDARLGSGLWFGSGEETDLVLRTLHVGMRIVYEPAAHVHHPAQKHVITSHSLVATRNRARGTGALWAKHNLPIWVILRGLLAPVMRPFLQGSLGAELAHGYAEAIGRLDGLLGWRRTR